MLTDLGSRRFSMAFDARDFTQHRLDYVARQQVGHPGRLNGLSRFGKVTRSLGLRRADLAEMDLTVVIYGRHAYP
jgi:hypothetical protein